MKFTCRSLAGVLALAVVAGVAAPSLGHGVEIDNKTGVVTGAHTTFTLTPGQIEEVETLGSLTLDTEQWQKMRKINPGCPKRFLQVFTRGKIACCCDEGADAVMLARDKVAILHAFSTPAEWLDIQIQGGTFVVDRRGQFYCEGVLIPFQDCLKAFARNPFKEGGDEAIDLLLPVGMDRESPTLKTRLDQFEKAVDKSGRWIRFL